MSAEYEAAREAHSAAYRIYAAAVAAYRARAIGDAAFLRARREYDRAMVAFDAAFAREQERPIGPAEALAPADQGELFP